MGWDGMRWDGMGCQCRVVLNVNKMSCAVRPGGRRMAEIAIGGIKVISVERFTFVQIRNVFVFLFYY